MASRLLRVNILSPITGGVVDGLLAAFFDFFILSVAQSAIDARLDVVEGKFTPH
jgi:hypothetical protein